MGTNHSDQWKIRVMMISGTIKSGQGIEPGGAAFIATKLAE
jgi:hypothetical protein